MMAVATALTLALVIALAAAVKLPKANKQPAKGIAEDASVRRRTVALAANGSTRPMWLGADLQTTNSNGNIVVRSEIFTTGALSVSGSLLPQHERQKMGCRGICGFRVNQDPAYNAYCCTNCAVYTSRTDLGYAVLGTSLTQHGARCVSRGGPFTNEGDDVQPWDSGDEMDPGDLVMPDLWPEPEVMSDVARHNAATEKHVTTLKRRKKQKIATTEDDWVVLDDAHKEKKKARTTQEDPSWVFARRDLPDGGGGDGGGGGSGGSGGSGGIDGSVTKEFSRMTLSVGQWYAY